MGVTHKIVAILDVWKLGKRIFSHKRKYKLKR